MVSTSYIQILFENTFYFQVFLYLGLGISRPLPTAIDDWGERRGGGVNIGGALQGQPGPLGSLDTEENTVSPSLLSIPWLRSAGRWTGPR